MEQTVSRTNVKNIRQFLEKFDENHHAIEDLFDTEIKKSLRRPGIMKHSPEECDMLIEAINEVLEVLERKVNHTLVYVKDHLKQAKIDALERKLMHCTCDQSVLMRHNSRRSHDQGKTKADSGIGSVNYGVLSEPGGGPVVQPDSSFGADTSTNDEGRGHAWNDNRNQGKALRKSSRILKSSDISDKIDQKAVHESESDDYDAVKRRKQELDLQSDDYDQIQKTKQEVDLQSDDYDSIERNRKHELGKASDYEQSAYTSTVRNGQRKFTARRKVICAAVIVLTVVVVATVIAVVVVVTSTAEKGIDYCGLSPCGNGTCVNDVSSYRCQCDDGSHGTSCEHNENECGTQPCLNGLCNDLANGYNCSCFVGYSGKNCQVEVSDNGNCIDDVNNKRCSCNDEFAGTGCEHILTDCMDILRYDGNSTDGIYTIKTWRTERLLDVYCDMTTDGGGWTVLQYRYDGSVDFYRNFSQYDYGFGNLTTEFWLGLSYIEEIASQDQTDLRIDLESANGTKAYETFENFYLSPGLAYTLHLGPTIDSLIVGGDSRFSHNGANFTTYDHDADTSPTSNAAVNFQGAWWYKTGYTMNLNGRYMTPGTRTGKGMVYNGFLAAISLKGSKMMMRRRV